MGELKLVPEPAGTRRGYNDLRRGATREHLGDGVRPDVASVADLARMSAALAHELANERGRKADARGNTQSKAHASYAASWSSNTACNARSASSAAWAATGASTSELWLARQAAVV